MGDPWFLGAFIILVLTQLYSIYYIVLLRTVIRAHRIVIQSLRKEAQKKYNLIRDKEKEWRRE